MNKFDDNIVNELESFLIENLNDLSIKDFLKIVTVYSLKSNSSKLFWENYLDEILIRFDNISTS